MDTESLFALHLAICDMLGSQCPLLFCEALVTVPLLLLPLPMSFWHLQDPYRQSAGATNQPCLLHPASGMLYRLYFLFLCSLADRASHSLRL